MNKVKGIIKRSNSVASQVCSRSFSQPEQRIERQTHKSEAEVLFEYTPREEWARVKVERPQTFRGGSIYHVLDGSCLFDWQGEVT